MKKQLIIFACVLSLLSALCFSAFAEERPEYEYTISYFPSDVTEFDEHYPVGGLNLSRPYIVRGDTYSPGEDVEFNFADYNNLVIAELNPDYSDPNEDDYYSRITYITVTDLPIVFYSYSSSLLVNNDYISGTLVVPETTVVDTTSSPSVFGGSVSDGVSSSVGFAGQVLNFIVDSPILICVGVAVGVFICGIAISKIKDLIKGY